eukprot:SAG31_NODE_11450_length_1028_cov_1.711518_1_plen_66_part_10
MQQIDAPRSNRPHMSGRATTLDVLRQASDDLLERTEIGKLKVGSRDGLLHTLAKRDGTQEQKQWSN